MFSKLFNIFKRTITVNLTPNVSLTLVPVCGGVNATLTEMGDMFTRQEKAYFASCDDLIKSLRLTDEKIIKKLSKAF